MEYNKPFASTPVDLISGARILSPGFDPSTQHDIHIADGKIKDICSHDPSSITSPTDKILDARNHLIAPSLCHAHIHLDKCFLLSDPKYADLEIVKGDFKEAMELTARAKGRFERGDLLRRGGWLLGESVKAGVTCMRAFVEVDHIVGFRCLDAALELKRVWRGACEVQVCVFAQEALFSGVWAGENRELMEEAVGREGVDAIGTTSYVEQDEHAMDSNVRWAIGTAIDCDKHLDFHLDYNLDLTKPPLTLSVVNLLKQRQRSLKSVALGHCTRLTTFSAEEWQNMAREVEFGKVCFVGLPTSDLFIQGKPGPGDGGGERLRGTLQIPQMIQEYGIPGCIAINNVGNAFTPYGSCDPLGIASMGVGLYHAGTKKDVQVLYECVSTRAKEAIGVSGGSFGRGEGAYFVLFEGVGGGMEGRMRGRRTLQEIVYDPPGERKTVFGGCVVTV